MYLYCQHNCVSDNNIKLSEKGCAGNIIMNMIEYFIVMTILLYICTFMVNIIVYQIIILNYQKRGVPATL